MKLHDRIKQAMARRPELSQAEIARYCGVTTASVSNWVTGETKSLKAESAMKAAALFGCDQNWLATGVGKPNWIEQLDTGALSVRQFVEAEAQDSPRARPALAEALPVVLDAIAASRDKALLRTALNALLEDDSHLYRQRVAQLLGLAAESREPEQETARKFAA